MIVGECVGRLGWLCVYVRACVLCGRAFVRACVRVDVCARARPCACARERACVWCMRVRTHTLAKLQ